MKGKIYKIKFLLSNGKTIIHDGKRDKLINEWRKLEGLSNQEIVKSLKLGRGKHKDIMLIKMEFYDWANNLTISKVFNEVEEVEDNLFKESEELNNS